MLAGGKEQKSCSFAGSGRLSQLSWLSDSQVEWQLGLARLVLQLARAWALAKNEPELPQHYMVPVGPIR